MLEVRNISKCYYNQRVLKDVSFSVGQGEIVGFLGPNGAGKSTLMKIAMGFILPDKGEVIIDRKQVIKTPIETQKKCGYLPENNPLYLDMFVREYLEYVGQIRKVANLNQRVEETIKLVGLENESNKKIRQLSKGYRQRVGLAQVILHDSKLLILDEPMTGLDPNQLIEIRALIKEIGKDRTIIFSSHIMQEVEAMCDRVIIINKGEIVVDDKIKELVSDEHHTILVEFDLRIEQESILRIIPNIKTITNIRDSYWKISFDDNSQDNIKNIYIFADNNNLRILQLNLENKKLEQIFNNYTK